MLKLIASVQSPYQIVHTLQVVVKKPFCMFLQIAVVHQFVQAHSQVKEPVQETIHSIQLLHKFDVGKTQE